MTQWSIAVGLFLLFVIMYYLGDFIGCYNMLTFSDSCEWFVNR